MSFDDGRDGRFMRRALVLARRAALCGEVPVGAVWVSDDTRIVVGLNYKERYPDPTAHAEIEALRRAARKRNGWRLGGTLYVTLEPCPMCTGALVSARIRRLVFGAADPKFGACGSLLNLLEIPQLNHRVTVEGGLMAEASRRLMQDFFKQQRQNGDPERWPSPVEGV